MTDRRRLVVVGNGMVGHKLLETVADLQSAQDATGVPWEIVTFCEEPRPAYDRVGLSSFFTGSTADDLSLVEDGFFERHGITVHLGDRVGSIDTAAHTVTSDGGLTIAYDALVLATGSYPFVPPVTGRDVGGTFVYRTIDDLEAMAEAALRPGASVGTVIGGGLLGLEAANALRAMGLETHVVEFAPRLMPVQVDDGGGRALRRQIEALGVHVHLGHATTEIVADEDGWVSHLTFADDDHPDLATDVLVFSAGIRPRTTSPERPASSWASGAASSSTRCCRTSAPDVWAIGECALVGGRIYGLVAPGLRHGPLGGPPAHRRRPPSPVHRRRHEHQAQAARRRRGQLRRRPRHHRGRPRDRLGRPPHRRLQEARGRRATAPCSAGCWSATPPPTAPSCRWPGATCPRPSTPRR